MLRPTLVVSAPVATDSGYGYRSRDIVRSLIRQDKYDIKIISTKWGYTALNMLKPGVDDDILTRLIDVNEITQQPDIWLQITIPNEFMAVGKFNIGISACAEVDKQTAAFIRGVNLMDVTFVSSNFCKESLLNTVVHDNITNADIRVIKPVEVLFEGVDVNVYNKKYSNNTDIKYILSQDNIHENFAFLFCGMWGNNNFGCDRKNIGVMIDCFLRTFAGSSQNKPCLILKTVGAAHSVTDKNEILRKIDIIKQHVIKSTNYSYTQLPNIYLIYGNLTNDEMNDLYNHPKIKAFLNFTHGEGYGRPIAEEATTGKPIIASNWSGYLDFLSPDTSVLIDGQLQQIPPEIAWNDVIDADSKWFNINVNDACAYMKDVFKNYKQYLEKSRKTPHFIKTNFSLQQMDKLLESLLSKYVKLDDTPIIPSKQCIVF